MSLMDFEKLSLSIDSLLTKIKQLQHDNDYLKLRESKLTAENKQLQQQHTLAQEKLNEVINRLKALEDSHETR